MATFGKWSQAGVPQKGWSCVGVEDLGLPSEQCQMCERQEIRYVHLMEHPNYPEVLGCGCVCAGRMEENYSGARKREADVKNAARRRTGWLMRKWKLSQSGNRYVKTDGFRIVVFQKFGGWSGMITQLSTDKSTHARKLYSTQDQAKLAAFDGMIWLKNEMSDENGER